MADKYNKAYWLAEINRCVEERSHFLKEARHANDTYKGRGELDGVTRRINCFWSYIQTVLPAFYSALPTLEVKQRKKVGNVGHACGAVILERNIDYALKEYFPFSKAAYDSIMQFLVAGQGVLWARYDSDIGKKTMSYMEDVEQEDGSRISQELQREVDYKQDEKAVLESISYNDFLYQICTNQNDIGWKGRRAYLTKDEVREKFGNDLANKLSYHVKDSQNKSHSERDLYAGKAEFKEIWCRDSGKVYWLSSAKEEEVIESGEPPIKLESFFPCSVIDSYLPLDSVIPLSDFTQNKDIILEIERLSTRKHHAVQAIRFNGTYDPVLQDLVNNIFSTDYKMIPNPNWTAYSKTGGLAGGVQFFDPSPYLKAVEFLSMEIQNQLNRFYENTGASDLIRGATSPLETATAQQLKSNYSSLRFSVRLKQVYEFFNGAMNVLGEIIAENFSPEKIIEVADPEDLMQKFPGIDLMQVVEMLQSDERRRYRIEITSDSLTQLDERQDRQERIDFIQSAGGFLNQMKDLAASSPAMMPLAGAMLNFVLKSYKPGKELEMLFQQGFMQVAQEMQMQKQQEQQNPMMQIEQQKIQIAQMESQLKGQKMQLDSTIAQMQMQNENNRLGLEAGKQQFEQQFRTQELGIRSQESQLNYAIETEKLRLESAKLQQKNELDAVNLELKALQENFDKQIQQAYLKLDEFSVVSRENEKLIEEKRLASQEKVETLRIISDQINQLNQLNQVKQMPEKSEKKESQPIIINNHIPKSSGRRITKTKEGYETREIDDDIRHK
jgi:hypothetical protein